MPSTPSFKCCVKCGTKIPEKDGHEKCLLCLGEGHVMHACVHCRAFTSQERRDRKSLLKAYLYEEALFPSIMVSPKLASKTPGPSKASVKSDSMSVSKPCSSSDHLATAKPATSKPVMLEKDVLVSTPAASKMVVIPRTRSKSSLQMASPTPLALASNPKPSLVPASMASTSTFQAPSTSTIRKATKRSFQDSTSISKKAKTIKPEVMVKKHTTPGRLVKLVTSDHSCKKHHEKKHRD